MPDWSGMPSLVDRDEVPVIPGVGERRIPIENQFPGYGTPYPYPTQSLASPWAGQHPGMPSPWNPHAPVHASPWGQPMGPPPQMGWPPESLPPQMRRLPASWAHPSPSARTAPDNWGGGDNFRDEWATGGGGGGGGENGVSSDWLGHGGGENGVSADWVGGGGSPLAFADGRRGEEEGWPELGGGWDSPRSWNSPAAGGGTPLHRSSSTGMAVPGGSRVHHKRPHDWRPDFRPERPGLTRLFSGRRKNTQRSLTRNVLSMFGVQQIHELVSNLHWDLRERPDPTHISPDRNPIISLQLQESAADPPTSYIKLFHPRLPWYTIVETAHPHIITISHLLWTLYLDLHRQISDEDYYCESVSQEDREEIYHAWHKRTEGSRENAKQGVKRVDYLGEKVIFVGLKKRDEGWEIKTISRKG